MRVLKIFVAVESVVLAGLLAAWLLARPTIEHTQTADLGELHSDAASASGTSATGRTEQTDRRALEMESSTAAERVDAVLGVCVCGTVRDPEGKPVGEASLSFVRDGVYRSAMSAANGEYVAIGLVPGTWELLGYDGGHARYERLCQLDARPWQTIDVDLQSWHVVKVRLETRDGKPLAQALDRSQQELRPSVVATLAPLTQDFAPSESQIDIHFGAGLWVEARGNRDPAKRKLAEEGYAGELRLDREPPVYASVFLRHVRLDTQRVDPGQTEIRFVLDPSDLDSKRGALRFRVVDGLTGVGLAALSVTVESAGGNNGKAVTDDAGRAAIRELLPGLGKLMVRVPQRENLWFPVRVLAGEETDLGDIVVTPVAKIHGRILDPSGKPATGAMPLWTELDRRTWPSPLIERRSTPVDAEGRFVIEAGQHRYALSALDGDGNRAFATVDARGGDVDGVLLQLAPTTRVRLRYDVATCRSRVLAVHAADDAPVRVLPLFGTRVTSGFDLPQGHYTAKLYDGSDQLVRSLAFEIAGDIVELELP